MRRGIDNLTGRRGSSMIEVVVVVTLAGFLLGLAVTTIHLLLEAERNATKAAWYAGNLARLSRVLRADVHAATSAEIEPRNDQPGQSLKLLLPADRSVMFDVDRDRLTRIREATGETTHRDVFHFPPGSILQFEETAETPGAVRLLVDRPMKPASTGRTQGNDSAGESIGMRRVRIEAVVARDQRFQRGDEP